jgi:AcrR family transcriptional regulator
MHKSDKYDIWVKTAYKEFATNGPDFSLKALSEKANIPRATLYYYFENKEDLTEELLNHHKEIYNDYEAEVKTIKALMPDLYELMYKYKTSIRFHHQLLKNSHVEAYQKTYNDLNRSSIQLLIPLLKPYFDNSLSEKEMRQYFNILTDAWYSRLTFTNFSVEYMIKLAEEIIRDTLELYKKS